MTHRHTHKPVAVQAIEETKMLEQFRLWLDQPGYSPFVKALRNPPGVSIGYDGLTVPTLSDDCPCFLLGAAFSRLGMFIGNRVVTVDAR